MTPEQTELLFRAGAMRQSLHPLKKPKVILDPHLIGFDMEWAGDDTLTMQFAGDGPDEEMVIPVPAGTVTIDSLKDAIRQVVDLKHDRRPIYLLTFYGPAEESRLGLFWEALSGDIQLTPCHPGIWNVTFHVEAAGNTRVPVTIFDVYHYSSQSLEVTAKQWGLRKLEYDVEHLTRESLLDPAFTAYAINDAVITREFFRRLREWLLNRFGIDLLVYVSVAGASMAAYRHGFLKERIGNPRSAVRRLGLRCGWGGTSLQFVRGDVHTTLQQWDADSQYPNSAIVLLKLPRGSDWREGTAADIAGSAIGGFCDVTFEYPQSCMYPGLPVFHDSKLLFPLQGRSTCTLSEVRAAVALGGTVKVHRAYVYDDGDETLSQYLQQLVALKREAEVVGQVGQRQFIKLMANAIIGKLVQHKGGTDLTAAMAYCEKTGVAIEEFMKPGQFMNNPAKSRFRIGASWLPEWNALILGYARSVMAQVLPRVRALGCSTDSYICRAGDAVTGLGGLHFKLEGTAQHLRSYRSRLYYLDEGHFKVASHAIHLPKRAAYEVMKAGTPTYLRSKGLKLPEAMRRRLPVELREEKEMRVSFEWDSKRRLLRDGSTVPWRSIYEYDVAVAR